MTNLVGGTIAQGNTEYNIPRASEKITLDVLQHPYFKIARDCGVIIDASEQTVHNKGDLIRIPNTFRHNSQGMNPNISFYQQVSTLEHGNRELRISKYLDGLTYDKNDSMSVQRDSLGVITDLKPRAEQMLSDHITNLTVVGLFNQLAGNTATSTTATDLSGTPFTGASINRVKLLNDAVAPSAGYFAYGSAAALANPSLVTATNAPLTIQDLHSAHVNVTRTYANQNRFSFLKGKPVKTVTFVSETGFFQLINQAPATNALMSLGQIYYSLTEGGKSFDEKMGGIVVPHCDTLLVKVPDQLMPRAVHSGTENALSRCAIICGAEALDFAVGAAYPNLPAPSFRVEVDSTTFKIDEKDFIAVKSIMGGKKVQLAGSGSQSGSKFDHATYVIYHSAAS